MHLTKLYVDIKDVVFDDKSFVEDHILHVCKQELIDCLADYRFSDFNIDIAHPGDSVRLSNVGDIVQPQFKLDGRPTFPGVVDDIGIIGEGRTLFLRGVAVTEVLEMPVSIGQFYDMTGPALEHVEKGIAESIHVALDITPAEGVSKNDYFDAMCTASKKAAKFLAEIAKDCQPDEEEVFTLEGRDAEGLPRVAYVFQIFCHAPETDSMYYGGDGAKMIPIIFDPNEVLDGALTCRNYYQTNNADPTYIYQNHPLLIDLMKRHGKDINFVGVIMSNTPHEVSDKKRNAMMCASLAKYYLKADGVIISKEGGGHPQIDTALICDNCEEMGLPTVLVLREFLSATNASDEECIFSTSNANAMVSTCCRQKILFPKLDKVIGKTPFNDVTFAYMIDPYNEFYHENEGIRGAFSQIGIGDFSSEKI